MYCKQQIELESGLRLVVCVSRNSHAATAVRVSLVVVFLLVCKANRRWGVLVVFLLRAGERKCDE